jgi:hypothetical protein
VAGDVFFLDWEAPFSMYDPEVSCCGIAAAEWCQVVLEDVLGAGFYTLRVDNGFYNKIGDFAIRIRFRTPISTATIWSAPIPGPITYAPSPTVLVRPSPTPLQPTLLGVDLDTSLRAFIPRILASFGPIGGRVSRRDKCVRSVERLALRS